MNKKNPYPDCPKDSDIRLAMSNANYNGWWQIVNELTVELNQHHKICPACNPEVGKAAIVALFGENLEVK